MNLTTLLKLASTRLDAKRGGVSTSNLAYAEVDAGGRIVEANPLASMKWGWQKGSQIRDEIRIALEGLAGDSPVELPLTIGGLNIGALVSENNGGWLVLGYDPDEIDRSPQRARVKTAPYVKPYVKSEKVGYPKTGIPSRVDSKNGNATRPVVVKPDVGVAIPSEVEQERHVQTALNTLRLLATTSPDHAVFSDAAMQVMAKALGSKRLLFFVRNGRGDLILGATSHERNNLHREGLVLTDDHPVFQHVEARGSATFVTRTIAPVIASQVNFSEAIVAAVRDQGQLTGYVFVILDEATTGNRIPSERLLGYTDQLVSAFGSLYSWISLISRYRDMVTAIDDVVFSFQVGPNVARRYGFISDRVEMFTGYRADEIVGTSHALYPWIDKIVHEEDRELVRNRTETLKTGEESSLDYRIVHRNGSIRWIRELAWTNTDVVGLQNIAGVLKDVSEIKAVEAMVEDARKDAEASRRSKTAFIATMSHEIRTPLGALSGYAQLLQKELVDFEETTGNPLPDQIHEFVNVLTNRSHKLQNLVHDLFELSNLEMGGAIMKREPLSLHGVIERSAAKVSSHLQNKGVELSMDLDAEEMTVLSDSHSLEQVLDNVLSNATKFTESGCVTIRTARTDGTAVIEVEDTGIGISEEYQCELFEAFSQEENWRNRKFGGTGLGLALSRRLLELLDGKIDVQSEKGKGSIFRVILPLAKN